MDKKQIKLVIKLVVLIPIIIGVIVVIILITDIIIYIDKLKFLRIIFGLTPEEFYNDPLLIPIINEGYWLILKNPLIISISMLVVVSIILGFKNTIIKTFEYRVQENLK